MRRPHTDHEGILPDEDLLALWKCDETSAATGLLDSSYSALYVLPEVGANGISVVGSLFADSTTGARKPGEALSQGWFESASASSAHAYVGTDWSMAMWVKKSSSALTRALIEHAADETPTVDGDLCGLGVYWLANEKIRLQWDISTASVAHLCDFDLGIAAGSTAPLHLGITKAQHPTSTLYVNVSVYKNGDLTTTTQMLGTKHSAADGKGANGRWVIGASRRWQVAGDSPAFAPTGTYGNTYDDIGFWKRSHNAYKMREVYRNGVRPWDERRLLEANTQLPKARVWIEDGDATLVNLSDLWEQNWVQSVDVKESVSEPANRASLKLNRIRGQSLNLSPLDEDSNLNLNASGAYEPLLELRRRVVIERAVVPPEHRVQGWEWEVEFDGFIDSVAYGAENVSVECLDKMAPLKDTFQLDPKAYDYYAGATLAETHLQSVIRNNIPRLLASTTLTFGYLGGTPVLYTPASSGWVLNYDDTPSGNVDAILQSIADQIGWDLRYRWHDPWQQHRLTFYAPPRERQLDILNVVENGAGQVVVTTRTSHGMIEGQKFTIAGTANFNATQTVGAVLAYNQFSTVEAPGNGDPAETVGTVTYTGLLPIESRLITQLDDIKKDTQSIRNAAVVKYQRSVQQFTVPIRRLAGGSGSKLQLLFTPSYAQTVQQLKLGDSFTITNCPDADGNVTATIGTIDYLSGELRVISDQTIAAAVTTSSGTFGSEYLRFNQAYSVNTASVAKYGFRQAAVYEASSGNIDTEQEAQKLADRIVSDLAEPTADVSLRLRCWPDFEIHDLIALGPDKKRRWTTTQTFAIVEKTLHLEGDKSYLALGLRHASPTLGPKWVERIRQDGLTRPGIASEQLQEVAMDAAMGAAIGGTLGGAFSAKVRPHYLRGVKGRKRLRDDIMEFHLSTTCDGFEPTVDTIVWSGKGTQPQIHLDASGNPLTPGTPYYFRFRHRDVNGNLSQPSLATSAVVRYLGKPPSAKVWLELATSNASYHFTAGHWCPFPFNNDSTSPGYDSHGLFKVAPNSPITVAFLANPVTYSFFRMPCDGECSVMARLGIRHSGTSGAKADVGMEFGLMRIGSTLPGGNASIPVVRYRFVNSENSPMLAPTTQFVGSSCSAVFVNLAGTVTAHSGDYIAIGVRADTAVTSDARSDVHAASGLVASSNTTSWAKFTVTAQD